MEEKNLVVLLSAGAMDWKVYGIYNSEEDMLRRLSIDWGDEVTIDDIYDDSELRVSSGKYYN
jgi:hypothetical protein